MKLPIIASAIVQPCHVIDEDVDERSAMDGERVGRSTALLAFS
jgi:hypothetical protein